MRKQLTYVTCLMMIAPVYNNDETKQNYNTEEDFQQCLILMKRLPQSQIEQVKRGAQNVTKVLLNQSVQRFLESGKQRIVYQRFRRMITVSKDAKRPRWQEKLQVEVNKTEWKHAFTHSDALQRPVLEDYSLRYCTENFLQNLY